jgi:hypothetical protein
MSSKMRMVNADATEFVLLICLLYRGNSCSDELELFRERLPKIESSLVDVHTLPVLSWINMARLNFEVTESIFVPKDGRRKRHPCRGGVKKDGREDETVSVG